ncbi:MAG TPA: VOC family protein [Solirubrobacteraceae bacterium]|nr:VOC family protein [Solirubrobacteraceae bacterium]
MQGPMVHFDIPVEDVERAQQFYAELLQWRFERQDGPEYWLVQTGGEPVGGLLPRHGRDRRPLVYFEVEDVEASLADVERLGGEVVVARTPVPGKGWLGKARDSEGNLVGLWKADASAA